MYLNTAHLSISVGCCVIINIAMCCTNIISFDVLFPELALYKFYNVKWALPSDLSAPNIQMGVVITIFISQL